MLVLDLFIFSISSWFNLRRLYFSKNLVHLFHVIYFIVMQLFLMISYDPSSFCVVCCKVFFFISSWFESFSYFSWWVWLMICQFCSCSLSLILLFYWSLLVSFISIYFWSDLYNFFSSANFGGLLAFFLLFLGSLGVRLGCLFDVLFISWGRLLVLLWTSLLALLLLHCIGFGLSFIHCHLFLGIFKFPLWFLQWPVWFLHVC